MNRPIRYKGYEMAPAAAQQPNGLFAANLTIERTTTGPPRAYSFDAIDFFFDEALALAYASRWDASGSTPIVEATQAGQGIAA